MPLNPWVRFLIIAVTLFAMLAAVLIEDHFAWYASPPFTGLIMYHVVRLTHDAADHLRCAERP